jgi:hypothetical protein
VSKDTAPFLFGRYRSPRGGSLLERILEALSRFALLERNTVRCWGEKC